MKQMGKKTVKILLFIAIGIFLFLTTDQVLRVKSSKGLDHYYELQRNSVDVLFVGSSHVYRNINPAVLFEKEGIAAYNLGTASQPVWNSYHYIVEAIKTQKPKVIVLEAYKVAVDDEYADSATTVKALSGMRYSKNRMDAVVASVENPEEWIGYFLGLPMYHSRYGELTIEDYNRNYGNEYYDSFLGYMPIADSVECDIPEQIGEIKKVRSLSEKNKEYLDRIVELAEKEEIQLLFLITPFCKYAVKKQAYYNDLERYAQEKGIPCLNGNLYYAEIGLDGKTDFGKGNHLSHSGADKFSAFLCKYLKDHYTLEDHRNDPDYGLWQENVNLLSGEAGVNMDFGDNNME